MLALRHAVAVVALGAAIGCSQRTTVVVDIESGGWMPSTLTLTVSGGKSPMTFPLASDGHPVTLPTHVTILLPSDAALTVMLALHGVDATGKVADVTAFASSVPHQRVDVTMQLLAPGGGDLGTGGGCAGLGVVVCEDFESGSWDAQTWSAGQTAGAVTVDSTHVHRGAHALHVHTDAGSMSDVTLHETRSAGSIGTDLFLRVWLFQPVLQDNGRLLSVSQPNAPFSGLDTYLEQTSLGVQNKVVGLFHGANGVTLQAGTWTCVEQQISTATPNAYHLWVDDIDVLDQTESTATNPASTSVTVGLSFFGGAARPAQDIWLDDVIVDGARIGCAR